MWFLRGKFYKFDKDMLFNCPFCSRLYNAIYDIVMVLYCPESNMKMTWIYIANHYLSYPLVGITLCIDTFSNYDSIYGVSPVSTEIP